MSLTTLRQSLDDADSKGLKDAGDAMDLDLGEGSDAMAMKAMMRKYARSMRGAEGDDNTPLTTRAIRELDKIQKEVVYAQTLIKVRLVVPPPHTPYRYPEICRQISGPDLFGSLLPSARHCRGYLSLADRVLLSPFGELVFL